MKKIFWLFFISFVLRFLVAFVAWHPDLNNHADWGIRFWEYGPKKFYAPESNVWSYTWPNQPPGTVYMFAGIRKLYEAIFAVFWWLNVNIPAFPSGIITFFETNLYPALLKLPAILADFGIALLIYKLVTRNTQQAERGIFAAVLWLFNPVVWYNSAIWGQYDAVINFFALLSFYLLLSKKLVFSFLFLVLSLYIKASLIIFVPVWLIVAFRQKYKFSQYLIATSCSLITIVLLSFPFSTGNPLVWLYDLYVKKVFAQQLHVITANAFNLWAALTGIHERPDIYAHWGYILFAVSSISLLYFLYKSPITNHQSLITRLVWTIALTAFSSFMLLTNMHERYLYPLFPYLTILVATSQIGNWYYWIIGIIGLLNLYNFWWFPRIDFLVDFLSFGNRLMPRVLGFLNFGLFAYLYFRFLRLLKQAKL